MPPTSTDLDLFILALARRGCATPYDLKAQGGNFHWQQCPCPRTARQGRAPEEIQGRCSRPRALLNYSKTGEKTLESGWQSLLANRPTDPDAILRITYLAWALGRQDAMMKFIEWACETLRNTAATRRAEANQLQGAASEVGAEAFRWLKTRFEAARLAAQARELKELGEQIKKQKKK